MTDRCAFCGSQLASGKYCPSCGSRQPDEVEPKDPLIGRAIADRYEIVRLIREGGMGRVYHARQRALDRDVAIKLVLPQHLGSDAMAARFLQEARTASRLNHPNVISIFDFGRAALPEGDQLFLVMELVSGPDLATSLATEPLLPLPRVANILRQVLAALGEAHHVGVTHRDVKPENILLEPRRDGGDRVKVIDFGIARLGGDARVTRVDEFVGTPLYMAPELIQGDKPAPSADLYAVGVLLFQLLTGRCPFDGETTEAILVEHVTAKRPDPRLVAPTRKIPAALADVCVRALEVDPANRYTTAEALAEAIVRAATSKRWSASDASQFPSSSVPASLRKEPVVREATTGSGVVPRAPRVPAESLDCIDLGAPLVGRDAALAWLRARLAERGIGAMTIVGASGSGRTRLLYEAARLAIEKGAHVVDVAAPPRPLSEASFGGLRALVSRLTGYDSAAPAVASGSEVSEPFDADGLRMIFEGKPGSASMLPADVPTAGAAALRWAAHRAVNRAEGARVLVTLDDLDRFDPSSRRAIAEFLSGDPIRRFLVVVTSDRPVQAAPGRIATLRLGGLSHADASLFLREHASLLPVDDGGALDPLYLDQLRRWADKERSAALPTLQEVVGARFLQLPPAQRRTLLAVAVMGAGSLDELALVTPRPEDLEEALRPLADAGFIEVHRGRVSLMHAVFARAALLKSPAGAVAELHRRRANHLAERATDLELRAYHGIRGFPDFEAFLLVEETSRQRLRLADQEGAIAVLYDGMHAARSLVAKGDKEAALSAWVTYGSKLATLLTEASRYHEARSVLNEIASLLDPDDGARVEILEQLADVAQHLERPDDVEQLRREASIVVERRGRRSPLSVSSRVPSAPAPPPRTERPADEHAATRTESREVQPKRHSRRTKT